MLQLWMAVTATANSEQLAVASLVVYDVYRTYINPKATGKQIVFVSRIMVCVYAVLSGVLAIILMKIGLSLGWVYLVSTYVMHCLQSCALRLPYTAAVGFSCDLQ